METTTDVSVPANYQFTRGDIDPNLDLPDDLAEEICSRLNDLLSERLRENYGIYLSGALGNSVAVKEAGSGAPSRCPRVSEVIPQNENLRIQREVAEKHGVEGVG